MQIGLTYEQRRFALAVAGFIAVWHIATRVRPTQKIAPEYASLWARLRHRAFAMPCPGDVVANSGSTFAIPSMQGHHDKGTGNPLAYSMRAF